MFELFDNNTKEEIAKRLGTDTATLTAFEESYKAFETPSGKNMAVEARKTNNMASDEIINRIVNELIDGCEVYECKEGKATRKTLKVETRPVTLEEIKELPAELQPDLAGMYMKRDVQEEAYVALITMLMKYEETHNPMFYHKFRQGLDILDLDPITYEMIGCNKNSMGYWLPAMAELVSNENFFKIPDTTIVKVPLTMLQLTRLDYMSLSKTTLEIVDRWAQRVFALTEDKKYFLKTGTYSSKFDFRNAKVTDSDEIRQLGEYLLYIHFDALQMAQYDLCGKSPIVYGVSTTNEWVVRDFIEDKENNPCIYHGMPLHTEYRVFVDFDSKEVFGVHPYWDPDVMKNRFDNYSDNLSPDMLHDSVIYRAHEKILMERYYSNKDAVLDHIKVIVEKNTELSGQWSIDIMQNGENFYLIDMALAAQSAFFKEVVPENKRKRIPENWIPKIGGEKL